MKILLVEDDRTVGQYVHRGLTEQGFQVELVVDGAEALEAATHGTFDLLILDLRLPGMTGLEVLRTLRPWMTDAEIDAVLAAADTEADERAQRVALTAGHVEQTNGSDDASGGDDPERVASGDDPDDGSAVE